MNQAVNVADNYEGRSREGAALATEINFVCVHTYPACENNRTASITEYLSYFYRMINVKITLNNFYDVTQMV